MNDKDIRVCCLLFQQCNEGFDAGGPQKAGLQFSDHGLQLLPGISRGSEGKLLWADPQSFLSSNLETADTGAREYMSVWGCRSRTRLQFTAM